MTILISNSKALDRLPHLIKNEEARLNYMRDRYDESKSQSGYNQKDIYRQIGFVQGLKESLIEVLQQEWCDRNDHAIPAVTHTDMERYLEGLK